MLVSFIIISINIAIFSFSPNLLLLSICVLFFLSCVSLEKEVGVVSNA